EGGADAGGPSAGAPAVPLAARAGHTGADGDGAAGSGWHVERTVVLLRGINVGRAKQVPMADLTAALEGLGYRGVRTHLRSGNAVVDHDRPPGRGAAVAIEDAVRLATGVTADVHLVAADDFRRIAAGIPFAGIADDPSRLIVSFLDRPQRPSPPAPPADEIAPDLVEVAPDAVYSWHPDGVSRSRVPASFWRGLGVSVTARNARTVAALVALLDA
ncbi:DUF1697 domain-containing protein, partial [Clavibacter sp. MX14-G9D]|uniref:DUF1697 domain-containing protein n=1 Tax=Clavibacter sp. MX14-G9D TaxID=3064656 RepID=UPI00293E2871